MPLQLRKSTRSSAFRKSGVLAAGGCTDESFAWPETKGNFYSTIFNTNITPTICNRTIKNLLPIIGTQVNLKKELTFVLLDKV